MRFIRHKPTGYSEDEGEEGPLPLSYLPLLFLYLRKVSAAPASGEVVEDETVVVEESQPGPPIMPGSQGHGQDMEPHETEIFAMRVLTSEVYISCSRTTKAGFFLLFYIHFLLLQALCCNSPLPRTHRIPVRVASSPN